MLKVISFAAVLTVAPSLALAAVEQVSVRIDGLACPFCAYNIEKRVRTLDGVDRNARIVTSVERGIATFPWKPGVDLDPAAVRKAIRQAGFTPREVSVTVTGTVEVGPERSSTSSLRVVDEKAGLLVTVRRGKRADRRESWEALRAFVADARDPGIRIEGEVHSATSDRAAPWHLVLDGWGPLVFGAEIVMEVDSLAGERCSVRVTKALRALDGVIHVEADHEADRVRIWTRNESPDTGAVREAVELLGFRITHVHSPVGEEPRHDGG